MPPYPIPGLSTLLDDPDILDDQLVHRLSIALGRQPFQERLHIFRPPLGAREEQVGEPLCWVRREGGDAEWDQVGLFGECRVQGITEEVFALRVEQG